LLISATVADDFDLRLDVMSYKVKTTRGEKAAYLIAVFVFLLSLFTAFWKMAAK
jgi:hypothetical protein